MDKLDSCFDEAVMKLVEMGFTKPDAVEAVKVDLDKKQVIVKTKDNKTIEDSTLKELITKAGYTVTQITREK